VLLILTFEISELTIKFVQIVFFLLNGSMSLIDRHWSLGNWFFFMVEKTLNAFTSLIVIVDLNIQNVHSFDKRVAIIIRSNLSFSESEKRVVLVVSNFLLLVNKSLLKLDFFSDREIVRIMSVAIRSVLSQFISSRSNLLIWVENSFQKLNLLLFNSDIFLSDLIKLSDKSINFNSISCDLI
jgi:hypothetical protein